MAKTINNAWIRDAKTEEDRQKVYAEVVNNHFLLDKLRKICYTISIELEEVSFRDYDCPSWSHKQAHRNGQLEIIRRLEKILEVKDGNGETEVNTKRPSLRKKP